MNGKDVLWDGKGNLQRIVRRIDQGAGELQSGTCSIDQHPNNHTDVATKAGGLDLQTAGLESYRLTEGRGPRLPVFPHCYQEGILRVCAMYHAPAC